MERIPDLILSAMHGEIAAVEAMIESGADPNVADESDRTALHWACQEGHESIVVRLLEWGVDSDLLDQIGHTPLYIATGENRLNLVKLLLRYGADVNLAGPLRLACSWGHEDIAMELLNQPNIDVHAMNSEGDTALKYAVDCGLKRVAERISDIMGRKP